MTFSFTTNPALPMIATMPTETIHHPVLGDARAHDCYPSDEALSALQPGDCIALLAPADGEAQIVARLERIESDEPAPDGAPNQRRPKVIVARIDKDDGWGAVFRPLDPAYQAGALIRCPASAILRVF